MSIQQPNPAFSSVHQQSLSSYEANKEGVRKLLKRVPFLAAYSATEVLDVLTESTDFVRFAAGEPLVRQDEEATFIYYVFDGELRVQRTRPDVDGNPIPVIERTVAGDALVGRYALVYNLPYTSTVTAQSDVLALRFPTSALERLLYRFPEVRPQIVPQQIINRLRTMPTFKSVGMVTLSYLAEEIQIQEFAREQILYTQEKRADQFYLIHKGQVVLYHPRQPAERTWLGTGSAFGFPGSIGPSGGDGSDYGHWAQTTASTTLYLLPWESMHRVARRFPDVIDPEIQELPARTLAQVSVFANFSAEQKRKLAGFCTFQHIPQHHLIMQQGDIGDSMWILLKGSKAILSALDSEGNALPRTPVDGIVYFGETALRAARNVRSTVEAEPGSLWLRLHWRDFRHFLHEEGENLLHRLQVQLPEDEAAPQGSDAQSYDWLGEGEVLVSISRRHWVALLSKLRWALAILLITAIVLVLAVLLEVTLLPISIIMGSMLALALAWGFIDYWNDYFIVTNQRIIQQEKVVLTTEYRREALLEQIERIDAETSFWGNVFGYGVLKVFTAGTTGSIAFDMVPNPRVLKETIFKERNLRVMRYRAETRLKIQDTLEQRLGLNMELPSRVHTTQIETHAKAAKPTLWQRFQHSFAVESQSNWTSADRVVWHKHWFILARQISVPVLLLISLLVVILLTAFSSISFGWWEAFHDLVVWGEIVLGAVALVLCLVIAYQIADWWNDKYEITRESIIDVEKLPLLLSEKRREAQLSQIQDVTYTISSPLEMLLNYGDVIVQTAASEGAFTFLNVPNPRGVKEEINRRLVEWRRQDELRKARDRLADLPDWFELYNRLEAGQQPTRLVQEDEEPRFPSART